MICVSIGRIEVRMLTMGGRMACTICISGGSNCCASSRSGGRKAEISCESSGSSPAASCETMGSTVWRACPIPMRNCCTNGIQALSVSVMTGAMASKVSRRIGARAVRVLAIMDAIGSSETSADLLIASKALLRSLYFTSLICWRAAAPS